MAEEQAAAQKFQVQRTYVKDSSFESPATPGIWQQNWKPQIKVDLNTRSGGVENNQAEVVLTVTITAKLEDTVAYLVEIQQAGLFTVEGFNAEQVQQILAIACPNVLFPYAREAVDNLVLKGGFPALNLQPVNFEALYMQARQQAADKSEAGTAH